MIQPPPGPSAKRHRFLSVGAPTGAPCPPTRSRGRTVPDRALRLAGALVVLALSGSCSPVCGCSPVLDIDVVASLEFEHPEYVVPVGTITNVRVTPRKSDGAEARIDRPVVFASSDTTVAVFTGSEFGAARTVRGVAVGEARLSATYDGASATVKVRVVPPL